MHYTRSLPLALVILAAGWGFAADSPAAIASQRQQPHQRRPYMRASAPVGNTVVNDFHSLGLIDGHVNVFRVPLSGSRSGQGGRRRRKGMAGGRGGRSDEASSRSRDYDRNRPGRPCQIEGKIKVVDSATGQLVKSSIALERAAAEKAGIRFVSRPLRNSGKNSLEDLSDEAALKLIEPIAGEILAAAKSGGVAFHCSAGHDRTGIVAGFIRIKYQHWPASEAIDEMRRFGHNWEKFSHNGGQCSWHEEHLRGFENIICQPSNR